MTGASNTTTVKSNAFQLTSSRRGWLVREAFIYYTSHFNSHPHEEDDESYRENPVFRVISTHILTKRMTIFKDTGFDSCTFQLTSSRRGWPDIFLSFFFCIIISTHILTKRMTKKDVYVFVRKYISTHILTKRMTKLEARINGSLAISTHILTKRMTLWWLLCSSPFDISTHILTKRMTIFSMASSSALIFQLTSSRRGWLTILIRRRTQWYFNSHPHEEDDDVFVRMINGLYISTHILTKRMTIRESVRKLIALHFNSHPHEEDDILFTI